MAQKRGGSAYSTLLTRACRSVTGMRRGRLNLRISDHEADTLETWRTARGLTRAQAVRLLILAAGAYNATPKHRRTADGATTPTD